jgi:NAD(P)-dependent dehydrogenase (short-subunit alcohol dehydrogenase family)
VGRPPTTREFGGPDILVNNAGIATDNGIARPEEVGWGALFLARDEASFVTGSELVVDSGGYTA